MIKRETFNKLLLLHLFQVAEQGILGTTKLQKIIFVLEASLREQRPIFNYKFIRWHYGPYCSEIQKDIDFLKKKNFIEIKENGTRKEFYISNHGLNFINKANEILEQLVLREEFEKVIKKFNSKPLEEVLKEVYSEYKITEAYNMGDVILPLVSEEEMSELFGG